MKKAVVLHPILFSVAPILGFYAHNIYQGLGYGSEFLFSLGIIGAVALVIFSGSGLLLGNKQKAGLCVSLLFIVFFSYGHVHDAIEDFFYFKDGVIGPDKLLVGVSGIIIFFGIIVILRLKKDLNNVTKVLNVVAITLIVLPLINIAFYKIQSQGDVKISKDNTPIQVVSPAQSADSVKRDVYFIIVDAYSNAKTLKDVYGFNNAPFIKYLEGRGFYVAKKSYSNYSKTRQSLASILNMDYVNALSEEAGPLATDQRVFVQAATDNAVVRFLKTKGYKYVKVGGESNKYVDLNISASGIFGNEFLMVFTQTTILKPFLDKMIGYDHRKQILSIFEKLETVPEIRGPKFVFAHIICPHPPFIFGPNGEAVAKAKLKLSGNAWENQSGYVNQVQFINGKLKRLLDVLITKSEIEPIIILQGDHGGMSTFYAGGKDLEDTPDKENLQEIFRILNVYYLPDGGDKHLYHGISPVNSFRVVFNHYFSAGFPLLEDKSYYSTSKDFHAFKNVTDMVKFDKSP